MLALLLFLGPVQVSGGASAARQEVVAVLERDSPGSEPQLERLRRELVALGPARAPELLDVLAFGPGPEHTLSRDAEEALLAALAHLGPLSLRPLLEKRLSGDPATELRWAALHLLARIGTSADLGLLRRAASGSATGLEEALRKACAGVARSDPRILEALRRWLLEAPQELALEIARGIGDSARLEALAVLAAALGYRAELDPELLTQIGVLAAGAPKPLEEPVLALLAEALTADDPLTVRAAALALGHAEDHGNLGALIPLLEHEVRGVRVAAQWALEHLSGLRFGADPGRWSAWLAAEEAWGATALERLGHELHSARPGLAVRALGELSSHRWRRHELALEAAAALEHEDPAVRRLACLALARLGSKAVVPELEALLEDDDDSVVKAAQQALQLLAGMARPPSGPRS